jgi:hypothetical protein
MASLFFSYSHKDEDFRDQLEVHLAMLKRQGIIDGWHDRRILAGDEFDKSIDANLERADVILLLVSADFLASDYCYDIEVRRAIERQERGLARVIPVILRPCDWQTGPLGKLLVAPKDGIPITRWQDRDDAFLRVHHQIKLAIANDRTSSETASATLSSRVRPSVGISYQSFAERLTQIGAFPDESLRDTALVSRLGNPLILDGMILRSNVAGFKGVSPDKIRSKIILQPRPLPNYVIEAKRTIPKPDVNRKKAFLADWKGPVLDQGGFLDLTFGLTDFWTNQACDAAILQVQREIRDGSIDLVNWPGEAFCDVIVITGDRQLLICQRAGHLYHEPHKWSASLEESIDGEEDLNVFGVIDPSNTVRRALKEELGLPPEKAQWANIRFVAIGTDWKNLSSALVTVVRLPDMSAAEIRDYWRNQLDQELVELDSVPLTIENGLKLLAGGPIALAPSARQDAAFHRTAKMRILISLLHEFGYDKISSVLR